MGYQILQPEGMRSQSGGPRSGAVLILDYATSGLLKERGTPDVSVK